MPRPSLRPPRRPMRGHAEASPEWPLIRRLNFGGFVAWARWFCGHFGPLRGGGNHQNKEKARRSVSRVLSTPPEDGDRWPFIWDARYRTSRATYPDGSAKTRLPLDRNPTGVPSLFGLAPGGVYLAASVTSRAVRSYRTLSPLPNCQSKWAVCFLWHFPWGRPRRALPGTVFPWSPDFPPPTRRRRAEGGHPTVWRLLS